jgi:hypothetical protein
MVWCLAEGMRQLDSVFLKKCTSLSMKRDESHNRLSIRFSATEPEHLESRSGILGLLRGPGTGAHNITESTKEIIKKVATTGSAAPMSQVSIEPTVDQEMFDHIRNITRQLVIDSASDETLSGRQMQHGIRLDDQDVLTPNLGIVTWDKAHGCGRITKRTFSADPFLDRCLKYVMEKSSIVRTIDFSANISDQFAKFVERDEDSIGAKVKNLGFAKHRFCSISKPLGRFVMQIGAMIATADWLMSAREGKKEAKVAKDFLANFTEEDYLQMALMADASDEAICLTRFHDQEDFDLAEMPTEVATFKEHCHFLFVQEGARNVDGYTRFALEQLQKVKMFNLPKQGCKSFGFDGDVPEAIIQKIFQRMKAMTGSGGTSQDQPARNRRGETG